MVKSRSSTSIFRSTFASASIVSDLSGYDTDSVITFRPASSHRPPPLSLANNSRSSKSSQPSSLPVTPGTPPTAFPFDPFSHPTTLPEPTRSRPASLAHSFADRGSKAPEIVVASPSSSTIHYLFPSAPSSTGTHLRTDGSVGRRNSQRKHEGRKAYHPADAFSASTRAAKETGGRTSRLASEPIVGIRESQTFDPESMRTLRRQPSLADIGQKGRARGKENVQPMTLAGLVEEKKSKALALRVNTTSVALDPKPTSPTLSKPDISSPTLLSPRSKNPNRRRSLSLSSPRPAPSIPYDTPAPPSPQLPSPNFGRPLGIEVGDVISSSSYTTSGPLAFPGGVPMVRDSGRASIDAGKFARADAERRLAARERDKDRMSVIPETPAVEVGHPLERRLSLSGRVRRSLSLKLTGETKSLRRRSQSVSAKGEKVFDTSIPLPYAYPPGYELGLGDPSVDMGDRYGLAKIIPSSYSHSTGLGLDVSIDEIGQRSPQRKRIDLGGSEISLLTSSVSMSSGPRSSGRGLGFSGSEGGSPLSLPESLMEEAVDLTERGRHFGSTTPTSLGGSSTSYASGSSTDPEPTERLSARPTTILSNTSTPYLSQSQMTSPNFPSPTPQTPDIPLGLASPAIIHSPPTPSDDRSPPTPSGEDHTTRYAVSSRKPNLRYSKSFTSDVGGKVARSFSWRTKPPTAKRYIPDTTTVVDEEKEKRLSRSFSFVSKSRAPVPAEMRQISNPTPIIPEAPPRPPRALSRQPSTGDISAPRWRPPTLYSLCSPGGAVEPLPTPPRRPSHLPTLEVSQPTTPDLGHLSAAHPDRVFSVSSTSTTQLSGKSTSPFLSASSSFRGLTKSLTKSLSRTFHPHPAEVVRAADSALKARISSPLEATRELEKQREEALQTSSMGKASGRRGGSKEWRESILTQVVSASIKDGLCDYASTHQRPSESTERTSWSRSVGRTFGLKSSSSASTGIWSRDSIGGSFPRRLAPTSEGPSRALRDIGKQESNLSVYSTASFLPGQTQRIIQPPPILISHYSPPKPLATSPKPPSSSVINYSHPRPPIVTSPTLDTLSSSPPLLNLAHFPPVPSSTHAIYRPPTPPSPTCRMALSPSPMSIHGGEGEGAEGEGEWLAQPLLSRLSTLPGNQAQVQGKEERVKKVLRWRREIGGEEAAGGSEGCAMGQGGGVGESTEEREGEEGGEEEAEGRLEGMIARHVEGEKERLRTIVRRRSVDEGLGAGLGF